jgi:hypothetical protein
VSVLNVHLYSVSILALDLSFVLFIESSLDDSNQERENNELEVDFVKHLQDHDDLVHETEVGVFVPEDIDFGPSTFSTNFPRSNDVVPVV